jgi:hypothetical protein
MVRTLVRRGIVLWFLARVMAIVVISFALSIGGRSLAIEASAMFERVPLWALLMSLALGPIDLRRRKELILLHNLGVPTHHAVLVAYVPALLLEATVLAIRS